MYSHAGAMGARVIQREGKNGKKGRNHQILIEPKNHDQINHA